MFYFNTLNLNQISGGNQVKQGDFGSTFTYKLSDEKNQELDIFDQKTAYVNLVLDNNIVFTTTVIVEGSTVTFNIDKAIPTGLYFLEIKIDSYIFPSDRQTIILVQAGSVAYDLKDLVPNYDTNMTIAGILSDLSQKGVDISDLKTKMNAIYNNALADHAEITNARSGYNSLTEKLDSVDVKIASVADGSPKGVYANLSALQTAKPTGDSGIYVTTDNGHWWYWDGTSWIDGGTYQAFELSDNAVTVNKLNAVTPKWFDMLTIGTLTNPGSISTYDANNKVVLQTTGSIGLVKLDLTSDDVRIVGKLDTNSALYWGKVIVITDSTDTYLRWEGVADIEAVRSPFLSYDAETRKFGIDIAILKQSYPTASRVYVAYTPQFTPLIYRKLHLSQFSWLQPIETTEIKDGAITQSKIKIDEELVLPATIPCVVGHEMNCYWENALLYGRINAVQKIDTEYSLFNSERFRDRFIWKPTSVNITNMKVMLWKKSLKQIDDSKVVSFKAVSATAGTGTKKVLVIGDSKTAYGQVVRKLKELFDTDSAMDIEYLGTRYDNNNNGDITYKHEGRAGWSISDYVRVASKGSVANPFYNNSTFDFTNYMTTQAYASVDYVILNLSTNDFGRPIADVIADLNTMIASIKTFNSAIKVIVCLTEGVYRNKMEWDTRNTWYIELKKLMIATYDKREAEKIYICPLYLNMDLYEDYNLTSVPLSSEDTTKTRLMTADGIHQNQAGFNKNANTMYYTIKYIESLG
ncbi:TPA: SGNH/GDSL hydrolase family protein [Streptococcus suis]